MIRGGHAIFGRAQMKIAGVIYSLAVRVFGSEDACRTTDRLDEPYLTSDQRGRSMKAMAVAGVILIVLGVLALAYQGLTYTSRKKIIDIGPVQATRTERKTIDVPPILGTAILVGGVALLVVAARKH